ncbi:hypothetical protein H310_02898 [Aphanomyces invadans]|uniref:Tubby C-terminal domain-containing protein n=1 Tax=Aphanomyces invadans TaxID=157072 RepID=A0A024UJV1_9STRA|nr:hypothetical protein H310_02898 [Aphanomyces invadans]ETW06731.1 hypothetical protein H310_02898 [Aphanomyces invadans]|eukprot:XP_008864806.1 hypothetical protein H310_02898 [Aphanomyces invadans]
MFMPENSFDDDGRKGRGDRDLAKDVDDRMSIGDKRREAHPNMLDDDDIEEIGGPAGSRSNVIQQQRDFHKKKMQERMNGGVVRSAGARQFSSPRSVDVDDKPSRFGRDDDFIDDRKAASKKAPSSSRRFHDDDDDDDDIGRRRGTTPKKSGRQWRDDSPEDSGSRSRRDDPLPSRNSRRPKDDDDDEDDNEDDERPSRRRDAPPSRDKDRSFSRQDANDSWVEPKKGHNSRELTRKEKGAARDRSSSPDLSSEEEGNEGGVVSMIDDKKGSSQKSTAKKGKLDLTDMKAFLMRPVPKAYDVVECYIERNCAGANKLFPEYCLYMKDGDRFLLTAKKRPNNRTSNYLISMQRGDLSRKGSDNFLGKLRSNFIGTEFVVYDNGVNPKGADQHTLTVNPVTIRQELGIAVYAKNVLGYKGPRKMKVCVPRVREDGTRVVWRPTTKEDEMVNKCKEQDHTNLTYLINKPPRWNDQVGAYVLNFNGRVTMASVKNFQLVTPEDQETVILQFGRVGKDLFTMDFRAPLCPFQAFAITLSSFDSKLACE